MIENINLINIDADKIEEIKLKLSDDILLNIACNYDLVNDNIKLLKSYGIDNIDELLINRPHIFLKDTNYLLNAFNDSDVEIYCNSSSNE